MLWSHNKKRMKPPPPLHLTSSIRKFGDTIYGVKEGITFVARMVDVKPNRLSCNILL